MQDKLDKLVVKGPSLLSGKLEEVDILKDELVVTRSMLRVDPRIRAVQSESAFEQIEEAYYELRDLLPLADHGSGLHPPTCGPFAGRATRQSKAPSTARSASSGGIRSCSSIHGPARTAERATRSVAVRQACLTEESRFPGTARCFHRIHASWSISKLRTCGKLERKLDKIPYPASSQSPQ